MAVKKSAKIFGIVLLISGILLFIAAMAIDNATSSYFSRGSGGAVTMLKGMGTAAGIAGLIVWLSSLALRDE